MTKERETSSQLLMPADVYDQIHNLPDFAVREQICEELFGQIFSLLDSEGIEIDLDKSGYRAKLDTRIIQKIDERKSLSPIRDCFAIKVVITKDEDRDKLPSLVLEIFPETPSMFPDGTPSIRDYSISEVRDENRKRNKNISEKHSAIHINGVFDYGGKRAGILEIQGQNLAEYANYHETRDEYETNRRNGSKV